METYQWGYFGGITIFFLFIHKSGFFFSVFQFSAIPCLFLLSSLYVCVSVTLFFCLLACV